MESKPCLAGDGNTDILMKAKTMSCQYMSSRKITLFVRKEKDCTCLLLGIPKRFQKLFDKIDLDFLGKFIWDTRMKWSEGNNRNRKKEEEKTKRRWKGKKRMKKIKKCCICQIRSDSFILTKLCHGLKTHFSWDAKMSSETKVINFRTDENTEKQSQTWEHDYFMNSK